MDFPEASLEAQAKAPLVLCDPGNANKWADIRGILKRELDVATQHPNFRPLREGMSDWELCFGWCFLGAIERVPEGFLFTFESQTVTETELGLEKYRARLEAMLRLWWPIAKTERIRFAVRRPRQVAA